MYILYNKKGEKIEIKNHVDYIEILNMEGYSMEECYLENIKNKKNTPNKIIKKPKKNNKKIFTKKDKK